MTPEIFKNVPSLSEHDKLLVELYERAGRTLDDLPYTDDFDVICASVRAKFPEQKPRQVIDRLFRLRKAGLLPRLGEAWSEPVQAPIADLDNLEALVCKHAGTLGQRDQLPYTPEFDTLVREFNAQSPRPPLSPHAVWRLVARIAK